MHHVLIPALFGLGSVDLGPGDQGNAGGLLLARVIVWGLTDGIPLGVAWLGVESACRWIAANRERRHHATPDHTNGN